MSHSSTQSLRRSLGMFATGVTVVTTRDAEGEPVGLTVNSFNSVSLDPPLIVWSLSLSLPVRPVFEACTHYAVNVLAADQEAVSRQFASRKPDRFAGMDWHPGEHDVPLLNGCCANFVLRNTHMQPGGDHVVFISEVLWFTRSERDPLLYFGGAYRGLSPLA
ncbi:flavin reductase family protein [Viridibacterium curvum]|uniref:Flavin reductase like domain-containing protein n=1 Tax=Viridibacterium curvum TaxID=1101404 RepID=A0ABP9QLN3_9RHOO